MRHSSRGVRVHSVLRGSLHGRKTGMVGSDLVEWGGPSFHTPDCASFRPSALCKTCSFHGSTRPGSPFHAVGWCTMRLTRCAPRLCPWPLLMGFPPASSWSISAPARIWAGAPRSALKQAFLHPAEEGQPHHAPTRPQHSEVTALSQTETHVSQWFRMGAGEGVDETLRGPGVCTWKEHNFGTL